MILDGDNLPVFGFLAHFHHFLIFNLNLKGSESSKLHVYPGHDRRIDLFEKVIDASVPIAFPLSLYLQPRFIISLMFLFLNCMSVQQRRSKAIYLIGEHSYDQLGVSFPFIKIFCGCDTIAHH